MELLIGTKNVGKIREIEELLSDLPVTLKSLSNFENVIEPEETGSSFAENACLKAASYALQTGLWALADDSGLEVEALNNAPGIFSARYAGSAASDTEKIKKLLSELNKTQDTKRFARFVCAMAIADEKGEIQFSAEGICEGSIIFEPRGENGFGYDPVFTPVGFSDTFGELSGEIKQKISHRARALRKIISFLRRIIVSLT